jgi:hypothetical protein
LYDLAVRRSAAVGALVTVQRAGQLGLIVPPVLMTAAVTL